MSRPPSTSRRLSAANEAILKTRTDAPAERARTKRASTTGAATVATPVVPLPPAPLPGRRNPKWIALGIVALCLGALLSYVIYARLADQTAVLAVTTTVHRGETVSATDLTSVNVGPASGIKTVPAAELSRLVGRTAVYDLVQGSLLPAGAVADVAVPRKGRAMVGVRVVSGRAPAGDIPTGSPLRLVALPPAGRDDEVSDRFTGRAILAQTLSVVTDPDGTSVVINVDVPAAQAPDVALLAAQERLAVVRDADR
ncbi:MAG TPA: SAF domain-containing protein [Propionibacteriaceae bacterium]